MAADEIISCDSMISSHLGTTKHICAKDSKEFSAEISKYIDSSDQRNDQKKAKNNKKRGDNGVTGNSSAAAFWPLIRQVVVNCKSAALSTGAILVDLPGVADANAARSSICKDYMRTCDCVWVLAPISRAVDDRTAKGTSIITNAFCSFSILSCTTRPSRRCIQGPAYDGYVMRL